MEQLASWQPREQTFEPIAHAPTSQEVLAALAQGTRSTREEWAEVQRVITETAPHDKAASTVHAERVKRCRSALDTVVDRLATLEGAAARARAAAVLWFYFGPSSYLPLHDDFDWSYAETETWLLAQCEHALHLNEGPLPGN